MQDLLINKAEAIEILKQSENNEIDFNENLKYNGWFFPRVLFYDGNEQYHEAMITAAKLDDSKEHILILDGSENKWHYSSECCWCSENSIYMALENIYNKAEE